MAEDLSEIDDLAAAEPERLAAMIALWWDEAERNDVLPLDNRPLWALINKPPDQRRDRAVFRYFQGGAPVPESVAVPVQNRSHAVRADVEVADGVGARGRAAGRRLGARRLVAALSSTASCATCTTSTARPATCSEPRAARLGRRTRWRFEFTKDEGLGGPGRLARRRRGGGRGGRSTASPRPASTGSGWGSPVATNGGRRWAKGTRRRSRSTAGSTRAVVEVTGPVVRNPLAEIAAILAEQ